jgi:hypothetical protein
MWSVKMAPKLSEDSSAGFGLRFAAIVRGIGCILIPLFIIHIEKV